MKKLRLTGRSKRMQHFQMLNQPVTLNLMALIDIFTVLVFFLLVNSSAFLLPTSKEVKLPSSISQKVPKETLIITITKQSLIVQGREVARVSSLTDAGATIPALEAELNEQASRIVLSIDEKKNGLYVTIMGDENIPYSFLRKILTACRNANYSHIAFAATKVAKGKT